MAMNKTEAKRLADAEAALAKALALGWSKLPAPVPLPGLYVGTVQHPEADGWAFNAHNRDIFPCYRDGCIWFTGYSKADSKEQRRGGSQRGPAIYATKLEAAIALRLALEAEAAAMLAKVDEIIQQERGT